MNGGKINVTTSLANLLAFVVEKEYNIKISEDVIEYFIKNNLWDPKNISCKFINFDFNSQNIERYVVGRVPEVIVDYVIKERKSKDWILHLSLMCGWVYIEKMD